jgi:hypothetical protein
MTIMKRALVKLRKKAQERIFGKINEAIVVALDFIPEEDVMLVNTQSKSYTDKGKGGNPKTTFSPSSSSPSTNPQVDRVAQSQGAFNLFTFIKV